MSLEFSSLGSDAGFADSRPSNVGASRLHCELRLALPPTDATRVQSTPEADYCIHGIHSWMALF